MVEPTPSRVAVVLGGGGEIGGAVVERMAAAGLAVVVADLDGESASRVAERVVRAGGAAAPVETDGRSDAEVAAAVTLAEKTYGGVDVAVHSVLFDRPGPAEQLDTSDWQQTVEAGLGSAFYLARAVIPVMRRRGGGALVLIGSIQAHRGFPESPAYTAAKGGLSALTRQLAVEYGPDQVRVNCVSPSFVLTRREAARFDGRPTTLSRIEQSFPMGRAPSPDEIAAVVAFLTSPEAGAVTGVDLPVDGGISLQPAGHWIRLMEDS